MPSSTTVIADILGAASDGLSNATFGTKYDPALHWANFGTGFVAKGFSLIDKAYYQDTPSCWEKKLGTGLGLAGLACLTAANYLNTTSPTQPVKEGWSESWLGGEAADWAKNLLSGGGLLLNASAAFLFHRAEKLTDRMEQSFKETIAKVYDYDHKYESKIEWDINFVKGSDNFTATLVNDENRYNQNELNYIRAAVNSCLVNKKLRGVEIKPFHNNQGLKIEGLNRSKLNSFKEIFERALYTGKIQEIYDQYHKKANDTSTLTYRP